MTLQGSAQTANGRHRVVVIGSGFGGLFAVRALRGAPVEVTLIDRVNHHLFQPLLYQVATGILPEGDVAPATRDVLRYYRNVRVQLAEVTHIELDRRVVVAAQQGRTIQTPYDSLIVATGLQSSYFGHDELSRWAPGMKSIDDALELRGRIFGAFEMAETEPDQAARTAWLTFVVVGGGPTGVEMAGQIAELSHRALRNNFRAIDPATARILLVEGSDRLLPTFSHRCSKLAARDLRRVGVEIRTGWLVVGMDDSGVTLKSSDGRTEHVDARTKVWAAGMVASPLGSLLARSSGAELDRMGRVKVLPDCSLPGHPEVFAIGDMMALNDLPGLAEVAIQSGIHAARTIRRRVAGQDDFRPFRYHDLGALAVTSHFRAVAQFRGVSIGGAAGWLLWLIVHLTFLTGFKNRVGALGHWAVAFVARGRSERVITHQQIVAREAIAGLRAAEARVGEQVVAHAESGGGVPVESGARQLPSQDAYDAQAGRDGRTG